METKKSIVGITMEVLRPKEHGRIYIGADGRYPLYRIAEVLLGARKKICFMREANVKCEQIGFESDVIMMAEAI